MNSGLPTPLVSFLAAIAAGDQDAFVRLFTPNAVLVDEGRRYRKSAIREWSARSFIGAQVRLKVLKLDVTTELTTLRALVDGNYQSWGITEPFKLDFRFKFDQDRISALTIVDTGFMPGQKTENIV